jgi:hypothetical protein
MVSNNSASAASRWRRLPSVPAHVPIAHWSVSERWVETSFTALQAAAFLKAHGTRRHL